MAGAASAGLSLTACGGKATSVKPTDLPIPTETLVPTATLAFTPTPIPPTPTVTPTMTSSPTVEVKMADLPQTKAAVVQFAAAMQSAGVQVDAEQIRKGLTVKEITGKDGKKYEIALTQDSYPLMIRPWDEKWVKATIGLLSETVGIKAGTTIDAFPDTPGLLDIYKEGFNLGNVAYDLEWFITEPENGQFIFTRQGNKYADATKVVNFALAIHMEVMGGTLIYADSYPEWLSKGNFSRNELIDIVKKHITATVNQFKGEVALWPVINELHPPAWGRPDVLYDRIGYLDLVDLAFQAARDADPSAILIYNDTNNHIPGSPTTIITQEVVKRLKPKNLIDVVGLHMHLDGAHPPAKIEVIETMKAYGLPVYVTEFDVNMKDVFGSNEERFAKQAIIYKEMMEACLESQVCKVFSIFTPGDKYSWIEKDKSYTGYSLNADATPFDDNLEPKMAYYAMLQALYNWLK